MRVAIVSQAGNVAAGAEHALLQFLGRLPADVEPVFFFFEDGVFAQAMRERFGSVTIVKMSERVATTERSTLGLRAASDSVGLTWRLAKALRAAAPDLVLTNSMKAHIVGSLAAKLAGLPCVNYVHDIVTGSALSLLQITSRLCAAERLTCSNAVSASLGIPRTTAVYAPIETAMFRNLPERRSARFALGLPDDDLPVIALVGRIARWKGQDRFIRIAAEVMRSNDAHFVIVGSPLFGCDPEYVAELHVAASGAGLMSRIQFVPWQEDMRSVYAAIDLACNCSTREPFGRTSLEALAAGIPVVCFDDAGVCEILSKEHCGTFVPAGDEVAFARAVRAYLSDPTLMANAQAAALVAADALDIANVYRSFADVLQRVGAAHSPAASSSTSFDATSIVTSLPR
jgi:glycosyltransferase involved in cell wall biosynthesis